MGKDLQGNELGRGLTQRKDGSYYARVSINRINLGAYGKTAKEAEEQLSEKIKEHKYRCQFPESYGKDHTVNQWYEVWFETCKMRKLKKTSHKVYKRNFKNLLGNNIGNILLEDLEHMQIQLAINELVDKGYSAKTICTVASSLRECLQSAVANGYIQRNVAESLVLPEICENEPRVLNREEYNKFLEIIEDSNDWFEEMWKFLLLTGLRIGECGALQVEDIDFVKKQIRVNKTLHCSYEREGKELFSVTPKTRFSNRTVPLFEETAEILKRQLEKRDKRKKELGDKWRAPEELGNLVFVSRQGSPVTRYTAEARMNEISADLEAAMRVKAEEKGERFYEFKKITPHVTRHTFCTRLFMKKKRAETIRKIMGHSKYQTTLRYIHIADDMMQEEFKEFEDGDSMLEW